MRLNFFEKLQLNYIKPHKKYPDVNINVNKDTKLP